MIHQWKKALVEEAAGIFERGGKVAASAEIAGDTVRDLHAKIVRLARERHWSESAGERGRQRFFGKKAQAFNREVRRGMIERTHPKLSVGAQCRLLSISRSLFYCAPQGETAINLDLMLKVDKPLASHGLPCKP